MKMKVKPDLTELKRKFAAFDKTTKKRILDKVMRTDAQGFVRDVILVTPPGSGKKAKGGSWGKAGKIAIYRDLVGGRGKRAGIFQPIDDIIINRAIANDQGGNSVRLFTNKAGETYGCERQLFRPDADIAVMHSHHQRYWKNGRMTQAGGHTRDIGRWKFIDKMIVRKSEFQKYLNYVYEKVGILAGGWMKAAQLLKVKSVPPEAKRHPAGTASIAITNSSWRVHIGNSVGYASEADLQRRVEWVLDSQRRKARLAKRIEVEIIAALKKQAKAP